MKKVLIFVFTAAFSFFYLPFAHAQFKVEYRISKMHGLINFVETISGEAHRSEKLRKIFRKSVYNNKKYSELINTFKKIREINNQGWSWDGYPSDRHMGQDLRKIFLIRSTYAKDMGDFRERTLGLLPIAEHENYFSILEKFEPVYDALVWDKTISKLERYRENIEGKSRDWGLDKLFKGALKFYRAKWPPGATFVISLYPIPGADGHSSGESIGVFQSVGVLVDEEDIPGRFGVIFHEICHGLYESQDREFQKEFERYFTGSGSEYASYAYQYINEALATALGNGLAYMKAAGKPDGGSWYNDDYINGFAKGIYPMVESYFNNEKPIDRNFVNYVILKYKELFPDSIYEYSSILNKIFLMTDGKIFEGREIRQYFDPYFNVSSIHRNTPIDHEKTLENLKNTSETLFVVFSYEEREQVRKLAEIYSPLKKHVSELFEKKSDYIFTGVDEKGRAFILMQLLSGERLKAAMKALKEAKSINTRKPFISDF